MSKIIEVMKEKGIAEFSKFKTLSDSVSGTAYRKKMMEATSELIPYRAEVACINEVSGTPRKH